MNAVAVQVRVGRYVSIADIAAFAVQRCKLCRGEGEIIVHDAKSGEHELRLCGCAREAFLVEAPRRAVKIDGDWYWLAGCEPERWSFRVIFFAGVVHEQDLAAFRARAVAGGAR